ncbi:hypothetical protein KIW84_073542 [Lathyrus oleraceus]|uniref:Uncharacterized protein n=1 Tax=Pisum sativum TaxID=3888 RepID=A0A9D4VP58_PEA|nr:hypothetical protein KIW84_073542 [Pisum sativum]
MKNCWFFDNNFNGMSDEILGEVEILVFMFFTLMLRSWHQPGSDGSMPRHSGTTDVHDKNVTQLSSSTSKTLVDDQEKERLHHHQQQTERFQQQQDIHHQQLLHQQSNVSFNLYNTKAARIEDQSRFCSDQIQKLEDNKLQSSGCLENTQRRLSGIRPSSQQVRDLVVELQARITSSRVTRMELQTELEKEMFAQKTVEEDLEVARRNLSQLKA